MGKRGPAPKPTNLKVLAGNPGKRELNMNEPKPEVEIEIPSPPSFLGTYAKKEWKRIAPVLHEVGLLTKADYAVLAGYCQCYDRWITSEKIIRSKMKENKGKLTFETESGYVQQIPEIGISNQAMKEMRNFAKEFGLTPSSRTGIHVDKPLEVDDPLVQFMKGVK